MAKEIMLSELGILPLCKSTSDEETVGKDKCSLQPGGETANLPFLK